MISYTQYNNKNLLQFCDRPSWRITVARGYRNTTVVYYYYYYFIKRIAVIIIIIFDDVFQYKR